MSPWLPIQAIRHAAQDRAAHVGFVAPQYP
jgi:hypothetical protein